MADTRELNRFVKHVLLAAKRREAAEKPISPQQISITKKAKKTKPAKKWRITAELKEVESRLSNVLSKESELAETEHVDTEDIKNKINELEKNLIEISSKDIGIIDMLRNQIKSLEHELRITEMRRAEEVGINRARIEEIRAVILELKERITKMIEEKRAREERVARLEEEIGTEARGNREEIEHIEGELAKLKEIEGKKKISFFDRLKSRFHKQPKIEKFVKPEEKKLFEKEILKPMSKPVIRQRPVVRHDIFFGEVKPKRNIPAEEPAEMPPLPKAPVIKPRGNLPPLPPPPKPAIAYLKEGFFSKIRRRIGL